MLDSEEVLYYIFIGVIKLDKIHELDNLIDNVFSDEDMYRKEGYMEAKSDKASLYKTGFQVGAIDSKKYVVCLIAETKFGELELDAKAIIKTKDMPEQVEDLYNMLLKDCTKAGFTAHVKEKVPLANKWKSEGYILSYKSNVLQEKINKKFGKINDDVLENVKKIVSREKLDEVITKLEKLNTLDELRKELNKL